MVIHVHHCSVQIVDACLKRNLIQDEERLLCIYSVEKRLFTALFFLCLLPLSLLLHVFQQAAVYSLVLYLLRRRFGGWHASKAWACQLLSLLIVFVNTCLLGLLVKQLPIKIVWMIDALILMIALITKPIYPPQVHFGQDVVVANHRRKNLFLLIIILLQCVGKRFADLMIYSMLAVLTCVISVYIENLRQENQRKRVFYESD